MGTLRKTYSEKMVTVGHYAQIGLIGFSIVVGRARIELTTNGLKVRCSTKLS